MTFSVTFQGKKKCQLDSENAAKSATLWGSAKCWDGGATRHGFQPIAYRPMCRRDTWRSAWAAVAGDSWCVRRTWTIPSSKSSWSKLKRSTGSTTKARWRFRATSRYSRKCSDSFRDPSRVRTVTTRPGSWISRIFRGTATWASGTTLTSGLNLDRCFMGSPTKLSGNAFRRNFYLKKIIIIKKALCFWPGCDSVRVSSHPRKEKRSSQLSIILAKRIATDSAELTNPDGDFLLFIEFLLFYYWAVRAKVKKLYDTVIGAGESYGDGKMGGRVIHRVVPGSDRSGGQKIYWLLKSTMWECKRRHLKFQAKREKRKKKKKKVISGLVGEGEVTFVNSCYLLID